MCIAGGLVDKLTGSGGALGEQRHVVVVEAGKKPTQLSLSAGLGERITISARHQHETLRHPDAFCGERSMEFPKRGVLAADFRYVSQSDIPEPPDIRIFSIGRFWPPLAISTIMCSQL